MTTTTITVLNLAPALFVVLAVAAAMTLAHRLPTSAPHHDADWGRGGDPWIGSDPLPLAQLVAHESERELAHAA